MAKQNAAGEKMKKVFEISPALKIEFREITARESLKADSYTTPYLEQGYNQNIATKVYAVCAISQINGQQVNPLANQIEFDDTFDRFTMLELGQVVRAYYDFIGEVQKATDPKAGPEGKSPSTSS